MKQLYHLSISCHGATLFRDQEDIRCITNILALTAFAVHIEIWADALMATHLHLIVFGEESQVLLLARRLKHRITKYHRGRHGGEGPLFDPPVFVLGLDGTNHILAAISYVLRNGLHHGQAATPFGYGPCSVNDLFREDLGKATLQKRITTRADIAARLPRRSEFPDRFAMDEQGMLLRDSFEELARVELYYKTPRAFLYHMNRLSSDDWEKDQMIDDTADPPVTLCRIEPNANERTLSAWLAHEKGNQFRKDRKLDIDVCKIIDRDLIGRYPGKTVYQIDQNQKIQLATVLQYDYHLPQKQIQRCLAMEDLDFIRFSKQKTKKPGF